MSTHSIAEAKDKLSELIDRARKGEDVVITEDGEVVARLNGVPGGPIAGSKKLDDADLDWLKTRRTGRGRINDDAGTFVSRMRDEEWAR